MKLLITLLLLLNVHSILSYVPEVYVLFDLDNGNAYSINATTGTMLTHANAFKKQMYFMDGCLGGDNGYVYFAESGMQAGQGTHVLKYNVQTNKMTVIGKTKNVIDVNTCFQQYGYDPVNNITFLPGTSIHAETATPLLIQLYDLGAEKMDVIKVEPELLLNPYEGSLPMGVYDQTTGNYYIEYFLYVENITCIAVYNMLSQKLVSNHTFYNFQLTNPNILYAEGKLYLVDALIHSSIDFYLVDLTNDSLQKVLSIPSNLRHPGDNLSVGVIAQKDNSAIVMSGADQAGAYIFTTVDLITLQTSVSPVSNLTLHGILQVAAAI